MPIEGIRIETAGNLLAHFSNIFKELNVYI